MMILARYSGPRFQAGEPRQIVIHSVESGIIPGLAESLARGWFRNPANKTSAHSIADPRNAPDMVPDDMIAWHCGNGNSTSWGKEHTGRASFSTAQWTTPDGLAMLRNSAVDAARRCRLAGIPPKWLSLRELANNDKGFCTHNDMRLVRGGTTHTDPGPGFPYAMYMDMVSAALGHEGNRPEDDMPYTEAQLRAIYRSEFLATLRSDEGREAVAIALLGYPRKRPDFWQMLNDIWRATTKGKP